MTALVVAALLSLALVAIAAVHVYWGLGGTWPGQDERSLARMVVGAPGIERMPSRAACFSVAILLLAIALWPWFALGLLPAFLPANLQRLAGWGIAVMFLARGLGAYVPALRRFGPEEPFATLDKRFYAPLCILLGLGFIHLLT